MKDQHFGIEMEMTGLTRRSAADIIAKHFQSTTVNEGGYYGVYSVTDQENRKWKIMYDSSISAYRGRTRIYDDDYKVEVVSPICEYKDIEDIQQIARDLRKGMPKLIKAVASIFISMHQNTLRGHCVISPISCIQRRI